MAHNVKFFFAASLDDPMREIEAMESALGQEGLAVEVRDRRSSADWPDVVGMNWVAGSMSAGGQDAGIAVEVHIRDVITGVAWGEVSGLERAPREERATGLCVVTLTGEAQMDLFERLRGYWRVQRGAVEFDEVDGFDG